MKLLLVEDEQKIAGLIKKGLEEQGYKVDAAYDGLEGLKLTNEYKYDLIILDLIIPNLTGIELCKEIRKQKSATPIIMLTALGNTEDKILGRTAGQMITL